MVYSTWEQWGPIGENARLTPRWHGLKSWCQQGWVEFFYWPSSQFYLEIVSNYFRLEGHKFISPCNCLLSPSLNDMRQLLLLLLLLHFIYYYHCLMCFNIVLLSFLVFTCTYVGARLPKDYSGSRPERSRGIFIIYC